MKKSSSKTNAKTKKATKVATKRTTRSAVKKTNKPVAKKVATKKSATKKSSVKKEIPIVIAPPDKNFWTNDGQIISDLVALADTFAAMDELLFEYHANAAKNDFADWVEHVLADEACAKALRKVKNPKDAHTIVVKRLRYYA